MSYCEGCGSSGIGHYQSCKTTEAKEQRKRSKEFAAKRVTKTKAQLKSEGITFRCEHESGCDEWDNYATNYCDKHAKETA